MAKAEEVKKTGDPVKLKAFLREETKLHSENKDTDLLFLAEEFEAEAAEMHEHLGERSAFAVQSSIQSGRMGEHDVGLVLEFYSKMATLVLYKLVGNFTKPFDPDEFMVTLELHGALAAIVVG